LIALAREYLGLPASPHLEQNCPNPFNSSTTIRYLLAKADWVNIDVYDMSGQKVRSLVNVQQVSGVYTAAWNGTNEQGQSVATGIYFVRLQAGEYTQVSKMLLVK
jgi:flagellar hook assembly protein FlgD